MNTIKKARSILETSLNACEETTQDYMFFELKEKLQEIIDQLDNSENDFYLETCSGEVRVISSDTIGEIWHDSLIEQIKGCYDFAATLENLPPWVDCTIDWDQTAENCKVDGMGHHFSTYDGQEHSAETHYIFRTN